MPCRIGLATSLHIYINFVQTGIFHLHSITLESLYLAIKFSHEYGINHLTEIGTYIKAEKKPKTKAIHIPHTYHNKSVFHRHFLLCVRVCVCVYMYVCL